MWKNLVFWAFCTMFIKKWEKTLFFSRFSRHIVRISSQKMQKTALFELFAWCFVKGVRKQCFFTFFETLCTKFRKKSGKNSVFLSVLHDVHQKVWENSVFSCFSRHFVQSSQLIWKIAFFELFARCSSKVWENSVFSRFSRHIVQSS